MNSEPSSKPRGTLDRRTEDRRTEKERRAAERRGQTIGLLILALAALGFGLSRAGFHRVFAAGWWRLW